MSREPFIVGPSRKPDFWKLVERHQRAADKSGAKPAKSDVEVDKPAAKLHKTGALGYPKENALECEPYRRLVAALPCANCRKQGRSQAAHPPPSGKSIKEDDRECFPLCCDGPRGYKGCHPKFDNYQLVPKDKMRAQAMKWGKHTRSTIAAAGDWPKGLPPYDANKAARLAANAAHKKAGRPTRASMKGKSPRT